MVDLNPSATTASYVQQDVPAWYQPYLQQVFARAQGVADMPFQGYTGPRIAPFTPAQQQSFNTVQDAQGAWSPYFQQSNQALGQAAGLPSTLSMTSPYYNAATGIAGSDTAGGYLSAGNADINAATGMSGMGAASPYLAGAAQTFPGAVSQYMSPYTQQVLDQLAKQAGRNLQENLMPAVNDQFVGHGQFGSERNREFANRALRDTQEGLLAEQAKALEQGYSTAGQLFGQDTSRLANLASTAGGLTSADAQRLLAASQGRAGLAGTALSESGQDINTMLGIGQGYQGAVGQDVNNQRNIAQQYFNLGQGLQGLNYSDAAALGAVGQQQQQLGQQSLDTAYQDFLEQRGYPAQQATYLSNIIRGYNPGSNTSSTTTAPATTSQMQPSTISQLAGVGTGLLGLGGAFGLFKAAGGRVQHMAGGGLPMANGHRFGQRPPMMASRRGPMPQGRPQMPDQMSPGFQRPPMPGPMQGPAQGQMPPAMPAMPAMPQRPQMAPGFQRPPVMAARGGLIEGSSAEEAYDRRRGTPEGSSGDIDQSGLGRRSMRSYPQRPSVAHRRRFPAAMMATTAMG